MTEIDRLKRRIFLLQGWRRWLGTRGMEEKRCQELIVKARPRGNWAVLVANDCAALEFQRLEFRRKRALSGSRHISTYRERAHIAAQVRKDVRLYLRPSEPDGELWDYTFYGIWYKAPVQTYVNQDPDDGSYYMGGA